jgi:hypothetical protein
MDRQKSITSSKQRVLPDPYLLKDRCGRIHKVRFTGKRAEILFLLRSGKSKSEIIVAGYNPSTLDGVAWEAKRLGLLNLEKSKAESPTLNQIEIPSVNSETMVKLGFLAAIKATIQRKKKNKTMVEISGS